MSAVWTVAAFGCENAHSASRGGSSQSPGPYGRFLAVSLGGVAGIVGLAVIAAGVGATASSQAARTVRTHIYSPRDKSLGFVMGDAEDWGCGSSGERSLFKAGQKVFVAFTHSLIGAAIPVSPGHWDVWEGHRFRGSIVRRSRLNWNVYNESGAAFGYIIGRDGVAAGAARHVYGSCLGP